MSVRVPEAEFLALDLEVHRFLEGVPLHDVSAVDLPGGEPGLSVAEVRRRIGFGELPPNLLVRGLFALRLVIGRVFGWDRERPSDRRSSWEDRLDPALRARSEVEPGTSDGLFRQLYLLPHEALGEIRNATVHAFSCMALTESEGGYRLYWAVYVKPVSRFTSWYMAAIDPFRRFIVYPTILRGMRERWRESVAA